MAQLCHPLGIATLVIIPSINLDHRPINNLSRQGINDARTSIICIIRANQRLGLEPQQSLQRALLTRLFQCLVDLLFGHRPVHLKHAIRQRCIQQWNSHGKPIQLPLELRINLHDRSSRPCRGGTQVEHARPGATQIRFLRVGHVHQSLRGRDVVNGRDAPVFDPKVLFDDPDDGRQTVGSATGIRHQGLLLLQQLVIAPQNHVQRARFLHGRRDHHPLDGALVEVRLESRTRQKLARALHDHVHLPPLPVDILEIAFARKGDQFSVDREAAAVFEDFHVFVPRAVDGVVLEEVGGRFAGGKVVDVDHFEERVGEGVAEDEAANAAEAVDCAFYCHGCWLVLRGIFSDVIL
mmetsp:Transcript_17652/g.37085  ORF Transcript_17652/g.37085 Transcript_17652/m.37085 type:complete len:351 (+) Transcript_17652:359-1411(+)